MQTGGQLEEQLKKHLLGGEAFMPINEILEKISFEKTGVRPEGLPYSFYELFYHIYYTQRDILHYCLKPDYVAPSWPDDYWPGEQAPENATEWKELKAAFFEDRQKLEEIISSEDKGIDSKVPSGEKHTIFREIILVIEHTAYHTGQLVIVLRHLGLHNS